MTMSYAEKLLESVQNHTVFDFHNKTMPYQNEMKCHIGFGIDDGYARCLGAAIASICVHNKNSLLVFHIMASKLSADTISRLEKLAGTFKFELNLYEIDEKVFHSLPTQVHLPIPTYFRFLLPLLVKDVDRVLYMDADMVCQASLETLFQMDLQNKIIAAVPDLKKLGDKRNAVLGLENHIYFNAGLILIDINQWNAYNVADKVMSALTTDPKKFRYLDQDALNLVLVGQIYYLEQKYNRMNVPGAKWEDTVVIHFAAHPKPWMIAWPLASIVDTKIKDCYKTYEAMTPWENTPLALPKSYKEMKIYSRCLRQQGAHLKSLYWYLQYIIKKFH